MYEPITYNPYDLDCLYIDVRSESEYKKGHIPGAVNHPILNDLERHEVGWLYKNASVDEAKMKGLEYGSQKLQDYFKYLSDYIQQHPGKKIVFYCARGGYRSRSITMLMQSIGAPVHVLAGGYKVYRQAVLNFLEDPENFPEFIVLNGLSGAGKTEILKKLEKLGESVLDLEGAANHRGSNLGAIGTVGGQSTQDFENQIYDTLVHAIHPYCFVESESRRIGSLTVPAKLFSAIQSGKFVLISASLEFRVNHVMREYASAENFYEALAEPLEHIKSYCSKENYAAMLTHYHERDYENLARLLLLVHYDPLYQKSIDRQTFSYQIEVTDFEKSAKALQKWLHNHRI